MNTKSTTLDGIYPPKTFLAPRLPEECAAWAPSDRHTVEFMTSNLLVCAGAFPMLVQKAALSPSGLELMAQCGLSAGTQIEAYETRQQYESALRRRFAADERAVSIFPNPELGTGGDTQFVDARLLAFLNNKANIPQLAPGVNVPRRLIVDAKSRAELDALDLPLVLKVATDQPNAGGLDVAVCHKRRHLARALSHFASAETLICEEFIEATENWCVQYAVMPGGEAVSIGASQQICMRSGIHAGNLISAGKTGGHKVQSIARMIAQEGSKLGFRGICGFDILVDRAGNAFAIDLNFRPVSSASFVLEAARRLCGVEAPRYARLAFCRVDGPLDEAIRRCKDGFDEGWLLPLATFDPGYGGLGPGPARLRLMIMAGDRKTLTQRERMLISRGIEFFPMPSGSLRTIRQRIRNLI